MNRYYKYKKLKGLRTAVFLGVVIIVLGGIGYLGREVPPAQQQVVKTLDSARFGQ